MWNEFLCVEPKKAFSRIENEILWFLQEILNERFDSWTHVRNFFTEIVFNHSSLCVISFFLMYNRIA
jgi:hypothetical protein